MGTGTQEMWIDRIGGISPQDVRQVQFGLGESTGQRKRGAPLQLGAPLLSWLLLESTLETIV